MTATISAVVLVPVVIAVVVLGAMSVRNLLARRRRAAARAAVAARARDIEAVTALLARLVPALEDAPVSPATRFRVHDAMAWLAAATAELCWGTQPALRKAVTDFDEALLLLDAAVERVESLTTVPGAARNDASFRFAAERLRQRVGELVAAAQFIEIVVDVEGCDPSMWITA